MKKLFKLTSKEKIPPGETIVELLEDRSMSEKELAEQLNLTEKELKELIEGKSSITNEYAQKLESIFKVPYSFWLNLQSNYNKKG